MKRALVIQPAFIGDAIVSIALAEALKKVEPDAEIAYLVRPECASLLRYAPAIDNVIEFDKYGAESGAAGVKRKAEELNAIGFDSVFCLHSSSRTLALVGGLTAQTKIGGFTDSAFTHVVASVDSDDAPRRAVRLLRAMYSDVDLDTTQTLQLPDSLLPAGFMDLPRPIIGIAPGSVWPTKRWPASRFVDLVEAYAESQAKVVLIGQLKDVDEQIVAKLNSKRIKYLDYLSKLSLEASAAVISNLDFLISNDSAPVHIAVATGTSVVDILGPTVKEFGFAPRPTQGVVVERTGLWCRPCSSHGSAECPTHTFECMNGISVDAVMEAARTFIGR